MKRFAAPIALFVTFILVFITPIFAACTPGQRQAARSAMDVAQVACIIANAALPDAEVKRVCGILDAFDGPMRDVLRSSRQQVAEARTNGVLIGELAASVRCGDGGTK